MRPGGYAIGMDFAGRVTELDTITCCHCNAVVHVPPKADPNGLYDWCRKCMKPTCARAACVARCRPTERWLEAQERTLCSAIERRREYGGAA